MALYRRISEGGTDSAYSEAKGEVLSEITRKASIKKAKELAEETQKEYVTEQF